MDIEQLRKEQLEKAKQVSLEDDKRLNHVQFIGGADVGFEDNGTITRAVIVVLAYPSMQVVEYQIARLKTAFPYIPGYLSFRECPALMKAWQSLQQHPDLLL